METFQHQPLDNSKQSIRLLKIVYADDEDVDDEDTPVKCELWHTDVEAEHVCLSYTWGPEHPTKHILINNTVFTVRENLWKFLQTARRYKVQDALWIDAICINQTTKDEKNHQVRLMGKIYETATKVIVWLGVSDADMERLHLLVNERDIIFMLFWVDRPLWMTSAEFIERVSEIWSYRWSRTGILSCLMPVMNLVKDGKSNLSLSEFLLSDYWMRVWTAQEIILASRAVLLGPNIEIEILDLVIVALMTSDIGRKVFDGFSKVFEMEKELLRNLQQHASHKYRVPESQFKTHYEPLEISLLQANHALELAAFRDCNDRRDRIFSVLSLLPFDTTDVVDYNYTADAVLAHLVYTIWRLMLAEYESFDDMKYIAVISMHAQQAFEALRFTPPSRSNSDTRTARIVERFKHNGGFAFWRWNVLNSSQGYPTEDIFFCIVLPLPEEFSVLVTWPIMEADNGRPFKWTLAEQKRQAYVRKRDNGIQLLFANLSILFKEMDKHE